MVVRFVIEHEASISRPDWGGWRLCLQWGGLTNEEGRLSERGYRNIWRDDNGRLFTGRAQARIPSKAASDELWAIAIQEGWGGLLGTGADYWQRVHIGSKDEVVFSANARALMHGYSASWLAAGCPPEAEVFSNISSSDSLGDRTYFFSPKAVEIAKDVLKQFSPTPCQPPNFVSLQRIRV